MEVELNQNTSLKTRNTLLCTVLPKLMEDDIFCVSEHNTANLKERNTDQEKIYQISSSLHYRPIQGYHACATETLTFAQYQKLFDNAAGANRCNLLENQYKNQCIIQINSEYQRNNQQKYSGRIQECCRDKCRRADKRRRVLQESDFMKSSKIKRLSTESRLSIKYELNDNSYSAPAGRGYSDCSNSYLINSISNVTTALNCSKLIGCTNETSSMKNCHHRVQAANKISSIDEKILTNKEMKNDCTLSEQVKPTLDIKENKRMASSKKLQNNTTLDILSNPLNTKSYQKYRHPTHVMHRTPLADVTNIMTISDKRSQSLSSSNQDQSNREVSSNYSRLIRIQRSYLPISEPSRAISTEPSTDLEEYCMPPIITSENHSTDETSSTVTSINYVNRSKSVSSDRSLHDLLDAIPKTSSCQIIAENHLHTSCTAEHMNKYSRESTVNMTATQGDNNNNIDDNDVKQAAEELQLIATGNPKVQNLLHELFELMDDEDDDDNDDDIANDNDFNDGYYFVDDSIDEGIDLNCSSVDESNT